MLKRYILTFRNKTCNITQISDKVKICGDKNLTEGDIVITLNGKERDDYEQYIFNISDRPFYKKSDLNMTSMINIILNEGEAYKKVLDKIYERYKKEDKVVFQCTQGKSRSPFAYLYCKLKDFYSKHTSSYSITDAFIKLLLAKKKDIRISDHFIILLLYYDYEFRIN